MEEKNMRYDVVICGGGMPGVCAAIAAARHGAKVALLEKRSVLGGNSSSEARVPPHGAASFWHNRMAREGGIVEELMLEYAARSPYADNRRYWDLILREWCEREPNLDLYLSTRFHSAEKKGKRIDSIRAVQASTETVFHLQAKVYIDDTGDGYLAASVGAEFRVGREGKEEFGENLAPEKGDRKTLPSALYLHARRREAQMPFAPPPWAKKYPDCSAFLHRPHEIDQFSSGSAISEDRSAYQLFWWFSLGGEGDVIKDNESIYGELVRELFGVWDHLKNHCTPDTREALSHYELEWWSHYPMRRESRRVIGDYVFKERDVFEPALFADRISYGGWPLDIHPPEGIRSPDPPCDQTFVNELYSVPFRTLYSKDIENLMVVGRCMSATHVAMGTLRVMSTLSAAAQAAGTAACLCAKRGITPRQVAEGNIGELQQQLLRDDAYIIGLKNTDPADLAQKASVSGSSDKIMQAEKTDGFLELKYDLAQQVAVPRGPLNKLSVHLRSERDEHTPVYVDLYRSRKIGRFDEKKPFADLEFSIAPGQDTWVTVDIGGEMPEDGLVWACVKKQPGVYWGYSDEEVFGTRFAVRYVGPYEPKPAHGKARIAPVKDKWFPINHNGRLPEELHNWMEETVGMQYDRKIRATLNCRVDPKSRPYAGRNVTDGYGRMENWPSIWISDPAKGFPQSLMLEWEQTQSIREILLTFDTDLDAPDRCLGWPREQHRFPFPVPECVRDYRILCDTGSGWEEIMSITGNYQRRRSHLLEAPVRTRGLKIEVQSTHGADTARVYEVRVY